MARPRVPSGIEGLDHLIGGGFQQNKAYLVSGNAGTGKTIFCLKFILTGLEGGESAVYVSIDEKPEHLIEDAETLGWDMQQYINDKKLTVLDVTPYFSDMRLGKQKDIGLREIVTELAKQVHNLKASRLVIDPIAPLIFGQEATARVQEYIRGLIFSIEDNLNCTTVITSSIPTGTTRLSQYEVEEFIVSGIILLGVSENLRHRVRTLYVRKMRGTPTDLNDHVFEILPKRGFVVRESI